VSVLAGLLSEADMSQAELAARSGVARETINKLCTGKTATARSSVICCLAWALEVPAERLASLSYNELPLGPRSQGAVLEAGDWVADYLRTGRDPWVERAS
jgi:transcriptional regulator with XRE-family HTH domain